MSSNTKYQPAPQRDSFEEGNYSQAPPSYQAEADNSNNELFGAPREEDDNVPDDFKVRSSGLEPYLDVADDGSMVVRLRRLR